MAKSRQPKRKEPVPRTETWRMPAALPEHVRVDGDDGVDAALRAYRTTAAYAVQPEIVAIVGAASLGSSS
jgi:hypothetical protein